MTTLRIGLVEKFTRSCGECTLCCRLLPVDDYVAIDGRELPGALHKPAGERCPHQRHNGCAIYDRRPDCCRMWSCRWLTSDDTRDIRRPDRCHYVIDITPDTVKWVDNATGEWSEILAIQIWVDPKHPDAHKDPALRAYIERRGELDRMVAIIRYSPRLGFVLFPPSMTTTGEWHEHRGEADPNYKSLVARVAEERERRHDERSKLDPDLGLRYRPGRALALTLSDSGQAR